MQFKALYSNAIEIIKKSPELFYYNTYDGKEMESIGQSGYLVHFNSGIQVWKSNKVFGGGLKSFRLNCTYGNNQTCNTHPHNYLIEILVDTGLVGFILIYLIFIFSIFNFYKFYKYDLNSKALYIPFFLIIFLEIFPLRSSGSFFTTGTACITFFMLAVTIGCSSLKKNKYKYKYKKNYLF